MGHVLAAVSDLLFRAKIREAARQVGRALSVVTTGDAALEQALSAAPDFIIIDLGDRRFDACDTIRRLKADPRVARIPVIGFFPHVLVGAKHAAKEAGCDRILPRSAFSANLPSLLSNGEHGVWRVLGGSVVINGWSEEEIERLMRRTGQPRERIEAFCRAVDKRLFLLLDEAQRRTTLHFHLGSPGERCRERLPSSN